MAFFKYLEYANIFLIELIIKSAKRHNINNHIIEIVKSKPTFYLLIYNTDLVRLEIL